MYFNEKEQALNELLHEIEYLDEILSNYDFYHDNFIRNINGYKVRTSLFEIIQSIIYSYNNIVLKDYYDEIDNATNPYLMDNYQ